MKSNKILSILILVLFVAGININFASAEYGIYYGTNASYAKRTAQTFDLIIIQPYNYNLYKNYTGKKICYLTVGEFDGTSEELSTLGLSGAVVGFNSNWNSFIMNMSDSKRQSYLISEELKLKNMGCNGLFLDTIWNDGQESGGIAITKKLRENWASAYIIPNNAHYIKNEIKDYVDGFMFENFWDKTIKDKSEDAKWLLNLMQEYQYLVKGTNKRLFAINYGNPFTSKSWGEKTKNLAIKYGFEMIYTNLNLTTINGYIDIKTSTIKTLPALIK